MSKNWRGITESGDSFVKPCFSLRGWSIGPKGLLVGSHGSTWTRRGFIADVAPSAKGDTHSSAGIYSIADLGYFLDRGGYGSSDVVGIVYNEGKGRINQSGYLRFPRSRISKLYIKESAVKENSSYPWSLSSTYKVPVEVFGTEEDLRAKLLNDLEGFEKGKGRPEPKDIVEWLKLTEEEDAEYSRHLPRGSLLDQSLGTEGYRGALDRMEQGRNSYLALAKEPGKFLYTYILEGYPKFTNCKELKLTWSEFVSMLKGKEFPPSTYVVGFYSRLPMYYQAAIANGDNVCTSYLQETRPTVSYRIDSSREPHKLFGFTIGRQDTVPPTRLEVITPEGEEFSLRKASDLTSLGVADDTRRNDELTGVFSGPFSLKDFSALPERYKFLLRDRKKGDTDVFMPDEWMDSIFRQDRVSPSFPKGFVEDFNKGLLVRNSLLGGGLSRLARASPEILPKGELDKYKWLGKGRSIEYLPTGEVFEV